MPDPVEIRFRRAAAGLFPGGTRVLLAVSGGADSTALLHLAARAARGLELDLVVAHLDHGLRPGSAADRRAVERAAASLGLRCVSDRRPVARLRRRDESPEEGARRVRREFLLEAAAAEGAARIATGHTLDDQAETVLLRLVRGGGPSGLGGMLPEGPGPFARPLLSIEREALRAWLRRRAIPFREDPTNRSLAADRNRVRHLVFPLLSKELNPRAARHVVEAASRVLEDARHLDREAARRLARWARAEGGDGSAVPARRLAEAPSALAGRVARLALVRAGVDPRRVVSRHVEALIGLARGRPGSRLDLPSGIRAVRRGDRIVFARRSGRR